MDQVQTKNITVAYQTYGVHTSEGTATDQGLGRYFGFHEAPCNGWPLPAVILATDERKVTAANCSVCCPRWHVVSDVCGWFVL